MTNSISTIEKKCWRVRWQQTYSCGHSLVKDRVAVAVTRGPLLAASDARDRAHLVLSHAPGEHGACSGVRAISAGELTWNVGAIATESRTAREFGARQLLWAIEKWNISASIVRVVGALARIRIVTCKSSSAREQSVVPEPPNQIC